MATFHMIKILGEGLVLLNLSDIGTQIWVRSSRRGFSKTCIICGKDLLGKISYRPVGNPKNRYQRMCANHIDRASKDGETKDHNE